MSESAGLSGTVAPVNHYQRDQHRDEQDEEDRRPDVWREVYRPYALLCLVPLWILMAAISIV